MRVSLRGSLRLSGALVVVAALSACDVGTAGGDPGDPAPDPGPSDGDPARIPSDDPSVDARLDALGIVCQSTLLVTGSFTPGAPRPADEGGCWADGTWRLEVSIDRQGCDPQTPMTDALIYEVTRSAEFTNDVVFVNDPDDERVNLKITTGGDNLCHGAFDHYGLDRRVLALRPTLEADGALAGDGTFSVHAIDPF